MQRRYRLTCSDAEALARPEVSLKCETRSTKAASRAAVREVVSVQCPPTRTTETGAQNVVDTACAIT